MLKKYSSLSLPTRVLIVGIYIAYFLVQLHFQFSACSKIYSSNNKFFIIKSHFANKEVKNKNSGYATTTIRLNKRYHPENILAIPLIGEIAMSEYKRNSGKPLLLSPALNSLLLSSPLLRGPPSLA